MTRIEELEQKVKELQSEIESLKFPNRENRYFYITTMGSISSDILTNYHNTSADNRRLSIGNCFRTEEEARFQVERLKVIAELKKFAEPDDRPWDGVKHYAIGYDRRDEQMVIEPYFYTDIGTLYFESQQKAGEAIETIGVKRLKKYYFGVKED